MWFQRLRMKHKWVNEQIGKIIQNRINGEWFSPNNNIAYCKSFFPNELEKYKKEYFINITLKETLTT